MNVLIVEDEGDLQSVLLEFLSKDNNGSEAWK